MTEVELQLRLDPEGRTIASEDFCKSAPALAGKEVKMDYSSKTVLTSLAGAGIFDSNLLDDLLYDCEIADCALLPRTFWIQCDGRPRCVLEQMALEVFKHHVKDGVVFDPKTSGAEWWVQIRPSPPAGRYNLLDDKEGKDNDDNDLETTGICFHWDKDEDLRLMMGGNMYIHPHISTVTYMSDSGAPTTALNCTVNSFTGEYFSPSDESAYLSWPKKGKHLSFDGRFLHAAPSNLMPIGAFEKQIKISDNITDENERKKQTRRQRRVTFLVNIWLNYKPFNVEPFPETMMDKLTKINDQVPHILFPENDDFKNCHDSKVENVGDGSDNNTTSFKWPMGGCGSNESISMHLQLESIQNEMKGGGNVQLKWICKEGAKGVQLLQSCNTAVDPSVGQDNKRQKVT